uniref:Follistatin-related protein 1 n=1 Tax=Rattus norvegicus TaxID=10116 RepID=Q7TP46_RAT|nr:Ab2-379 [Rattus norvegicus]
MALSATDEIDFPDWQVFFRVPGGSTLLFFRVLAGLPSSSSLLHFLLKGQSQAELRQPGKLFCIAAQGCEEQRSKSKICANVFCGAGRECAVTEKGEPTCLCIEQCKPHKRPVCGSNGKTYLNHCELHRDACLTGSKIQVDYDGHCKEKKSVSPSASPVVCYQANRDELRRRIIQWLEAEIIPDGWFSKGSNYSEILDKYFKSFDNGDSHLDSSEFLKFVEQNETAVNITAYPNQENNKLLRYNLGDKVYAEKAGVYADLLIRANQILGANIKHFECKQHQTNALHSFKSYIPFHAVCHLSSDVTSLLMSPLFWNGWLTSHTTDDSLHWRKVCKRGLCVDALIELSDENADWKLSFQEFLKCLNPSFNPPEKKCALEDETYADGAETEVDCNRCVCSCGHWVCTAMTCDGKNQKGVQTHTEEEMTRYAQELQKHQKKKEEEEAKEKAEEEEKEEEEEEKEEEEKEEEGRKEEEEITIFAEEQMGEDHYIRLRHCACMCVGSYSGTACEILHGFENDLIGASGNEARQTYVKKASME